MLSGDSELLKISSANKTYWIGHEEQNTIKSSDSEVLNELLFRIVKNAFCNDLNGDFLTQT